MDAEVGAPKTPKARGVAARANPLWTGLALGGRVPIGVSRPGDASEREADRVADAVMRAPDARAQPGATPHGHGLVWRKAADSAAVPTTGSRFAGPLGSGAALDARSRAFFEPRFDRPLGDVRVHADAEAGRAARDLRARAFTVGPHVVFAAGEYDPASDRGRTLLAHELAHVVQQHGTAPRVQRTLSVDPTQPTDPRDPLSALPAAAFPAFAFSQMGSIVHGLCDPVVPAAADSRERVRAAAREIGMELRGEARAAQSPAA